MDTMRRRKADRHSGRLASIAAIVSVALLGGLLGSRHAAACGLASCDEVNSSCYNQCGAIPSVPELDGDNIVASADFCCNYYVHNLFEAGTAWNATLIRVSDGKIVGEDHTSSPPIPTT